MDKTKRIMLNVDKKLGEKIERLAAAEGRSLSNFCVQIIKEALKDK
jgi:predicted HicB family RNase H-like nuclease